jgi:hypothetical protein
VKSFIDVSDISSYILNIFLKNNKSPKNINPILSKIDFSFFFPELNFENPINYINDKLILNKINYNKNKIIKKLNYNTTKNNENIKFP